MTDTVTVLINPFGDTSARQNNVETSGGNIVDFEEWAHNAEIERFIRRQQKLQAHYKKRYPQYFKPGYQCNPHITTDSDENFDSSYCCSALRTTGRKKERKALSGQIYGPGML